MLRTERQEKCFWARKEKLLKILLFRIGHATHRLQPGALRPPIETFPWLLLKTFRYTIILITCKFHGSLFRFSFSRSSTLEMKTLSVAGHETPVFRHFVFIPHRAFPGEILLPPCLPPPKPEILLSSIILLWPFM
jgi:hypothetical protein